MNEHLVPIMQNERDEVLTKRKKIIVIGAGPVAIKFSTKVFEKSNEFDIHIFSNEPFEPYNKKKLSAWLAGQLDRSNIKMDLTQLNAVDGFEISHVKIEEINKKNKTVLDRLGVEHHYDFLVLATGARANIPNITGVNLKGVYTFRNLKDAEHLYARLARSRNVVVVGGGLSGIQTAINLKKYNTNVVLVEQKNHLMSRHLDERSSVFIHNELSKLNISVSYSSGLREVIGSDEISNQVNSQVTKVRLFGNKILECDTVILCTGIKSNIELARKSNLAIGDGVIVNDQLKASNQTIFAIGGCCEHRGKTYGALSAGLSQAKVAAAAITHTPLSNQSLTGQNLSKDESAKKELTYQGTKVINQMQIGQLPILSMGDSHEIKNIPQCEILIYENKRKNIYRKLILVKHKLIGVIVVGNWINQDHVIDYFETNKRLTAWQRLLFKYTGKIK